MARKLSPTLPLIIVTLETNLLQQQKEKWTRNETLIHLGASKFFQSALGHKQIDKRKHVYGIIENDTRVPSLISFSFSCRLLFLTSLCFATTGWMVIWTSYKIVVTAWDNAQHPFYFLEVSCLSNWFLQTTFSSVKAPKLLELDQFTQPHNARFSNGYGTRATT